MLIIVDRVMGKTLCTVAQFFVTLKQLQGIFLVIQWLRLHACNARGMGLNPGQGTRIPHAVWCSQKIIKSNKELSSTRNLKSCFPLEIRFYHQLRSVDQRQLRKSKKTQLILVYICSFFSLKNFIEVQLIYSIICFRHTTQPFTIF